MSSGTLFVLVGIVCGSLTGFVGGGAGIVIIPLLVFLFGFTQHQAQGTALAAFIMPVTIAGAFLYWRGGNVNLGAAAWLAVGLFAGNFLGAHLALKIPSETLAKLFGVMLSVIALKMIFFTK